MASRFAATGLTCVLFIGPLGAGPMPVGTCTVTVSYETAGGTQSYTDDADYAGGAGANDAIALGAAPNISLFQSAGSEVGVFGRRAAPILLNNPNIPPVFRWNETLITHALFKLNNANDFFTDYTGGLNGDITLTVEGIQFSQPVVILEDTLLLHARWSAEQADPVFYLNGDIYIRLENVHTMTDPFRDFDSFFSRLFFDTPAPNYVLNDADLSVTITGNGTDTLGLAVTFPYEILKHLEAVSDIPPDADLPAPFGFLEPFHFHLEYVVAPATSYPSVADTSKLDFFRGGSQPSAQYEQLLSSINCGACHGGDDATILINKPWAGSMHALSARDPLWRASFVVAEQDAPEVGDMCIRCHVPRAWISGRSTPTDGSAINFTDRDSVNCHFCHRLVDPFYKPGISPPEDELILENIVELPVTIGSASFVLDPSDGRRGSRGGTTDQHTDILSPYHGESQICALCHDVSNPTLNRQPDDTYVGNTPHEPHPTGNKYDMFPGERTFSEWAVSEYALQGVDVGERFGGNKQIVRSCQDCHMPDTDSLAATDGPMRTDMADHGMYGGGTWIPLVVANLFPNEVDADAIAAGVAGSESMLQRAATLVLSQSGDAVDVRVVNETGHKLPTGQPEGRQMWLNVRFFDSGGTLIAERGAYDEQTGRPHEDDTKMYEILLGLSEDTAQWAGLPVGPSHHVAFCSVIYKDSRIPPRGFTNEEFRRIQSPVVAAAYADGQYWDDTRFALPRDTARVDVAVYYKTASTDFIEFLRDANHTNDAGQVLYDQWEATGKSPPVEMVADTITLVPFSLGDFDGNATTNFDDFVGFVDCLDGPGTGPAGPTCMPGDIDGDLDVDLADAGRFLRRLGFAE